MLLSVASIYVTSSWFILMLWQMLVKHKLSIRPLFHGNPLFVELCYVLYILVWSRENVLQILTRVKMWFVFYLFWPIRFQRSHPLGPYLSHFNFCYILVRNYDVRYHISNNYWKKFHEILEWNNHVVILFFVLRISFYFQ